MNFYILAPANINSGGAELAHQLCYTINKNTNYSAYMCYVNTSETNLINSLPIDANAIESYSTYYTEHALSLTDIDSDENIVIIPEGLTPSILVFKYAKIVLWWMSVDNYILSTQETNLELLKTQTILHLYQSYYSKIYIEQHFPNCPKMYLSDYINEQHGNFLFPGEYRKNVALYNPKKGYPNIEPLIKEITWIDWKPIYNMTIEEVIILMQSSKIYIDFGNHPGKDRIPREAAANGCCVITNKLGSAAYHEDVPIPEQYKFETPQKSIKEIETLMLDICAHYGKHQKLFSNYRDWIKSEKSTFEHDAISFVKYMEALCCNFLS